MPLSASSAFCTLVCATIRSRSAGGHLGLRGDHVERRHSADFELPAVLFFQLLGYVHSLLRGAHGALRGHQVPVGVLRVHQGGHHLLAEGFALDLLLVLRHLR